MLDQNKTIARRLTEEVIGAGDLTILEELVDPRYAGHSSQPGPDTVGLEGYRQFVTTLHQAFPDLEIRVEDQVAEGDRVVSRWTASGTHLGDFFGVPASGRKDRITGISIDRLEDGKVVECWTNSDDLALMQQIGAIPAPAGA